MKLKIYPTALCRTPLFSYTSQLTTVWEELKQAIKDASPDLYQFIAETDNTEIERLDPKIRFACWKYFNRAIYRATPYGAFGAISSLSIRKGNEPIQLKYEQTLHSFVNWAQKEPIVNDTVALLGKAKQFALNSSLYPCGPYYRYISIVGSRFELSAIGKERLLDDLFDYVKTRKKKEAVYDFLATKHQLQPNIIEDLLLQLIDGQLLLTDLHPNIIGTDYFQRIGADFVMTDPYVIAERTPIKGHLSMDQLKTIPEAIALLSPGIPKMQNAHLENFKTAFLQKFEYLQVPLMTALDPELGIGYGGLETSIGNNPLIEELKDQKDQRETFTSLPYTPLHRFILNRMIAKDQEIDLFFYNPDIGRSGDAPASVKRPFPNTFNAMIQISDDKVIVDYAGGSTANALLGRFTVASEAVSQQCADLVQVEEQANPGILFFDIGYQAENKVDNINRRRAIYAHELPILSWSENKQHLNIQDILISVQDNDIVLYSQQYKKRLIPRLASAYNYSRSDLAVYRFLADLQNQGIQTNLSIKLIELWPGLDYYPRLVYKHLVLSPKMWKVPVAITTTKKDTQSLIRWLKQNQVSRYFKCGNSDQQLYFDSHQEQDLTYFLQYGHGKQDLYITEAFIPQTATIQNEKGGPLLAQFVVSLTHSETIYPNTTVRSHPLINSRKKLLTPGNEWLYFEVYAHPTRGNALLSQNISSFLKQTRKHIRSWFFIRYNLPAPHIRFRVQVKQVEDIALLIQCFSSAFQEEIRTGMVTDLQLKTYVREIERYGEKTIEQVERHFYLDSQYVLRLLNRKYTDEQLHLLSLRFINDIFKHLKTDMPMQLGFVKSLGNQFAKEMRTTVTGFQKINAHYQSLKRQQLPVLPQKTEKMYQRLVENIASLLSSFDREKHLRLLSDLIHMHVNRLFPDDQRMHELLIYQYLFKQLLSKKGI